MWRIEFWLKAPALIWIVDELIVWLPYVLVLSLIHPSELVDLESYVVLSYRGVTLVVVFPQCARSTLRGSVNLIPLRREKETDISLTSL